MAKEMMPPQLPLAATIFPGRTVLTLSEVAKALRWTETHIKDLIDEGQLVAIDIASPAAPGTKRRASACAYPSALTTASSVNAPVSGEMMIGYEF